MPQEKDKKLKLNIVSVPPALSVDGSGIKIIDNQYAEIVFLQTIEQDGDNINARGVCNLRMNLDQLKDFRNTINKVVEEHFKEEKK